MNLLKHTQLTNHLIANSSIITDDSTHCTSTTNNNDQESSSTETTTQLLSTDQQTIEISKFWTIRKNKIYENSYTCKN